MVRSHKISIIGPGRVGTALGRLAFRVGYGIAAVAGGSDPQRTADRAASMGKAQVLPTAEAAAAGELVLLTVHDAAIEPVCEQIAVAGGLAHKPVVAHCSGVLDCSALASAKAIGCPVGSMHPLQTFPDIETAIGAIPGTYFFIEGDDKAAAALEELARAVGGQTVRIPSSAKPVYHAAAVMTSNYLTTLLATAMELYEEVGMDHEHARKAMAPIAIATLNNVLRMGPAEALTGPIARGDVDTVKKHLAAMEDMHDTVVDVYRTIGMRTVNMAETGGHINAETAQTLRGLLGGEG